MPTLPVLSTETTVEVPLGLEDAIKKRFVVEPTEPSGVATVKSAIGEEVPTPTRKFPTVPSPLLSP